MGALKVGDLVERVEYEGGHDHCFKVGSKAIVTGIGTYHYHEGLLIEFSNGARLFSKRVRKVEERVIKGDDDEDCV